VVVWFVHDNEQKVSKNGEKSFQIKRVTGLDFGQLFQRR